MREHPGLGVQPLSIGQSQVFVVPNPSPANAAVSLEALVSWYTQLRSLVEIGTGNG